MTVTEMNLKICEILGIPSDVLRAEIILEPRTPPRVITVRHVKAFGNESITERFKLVPADAQESAT
jgi:hypothetical protein